MPDILDPARRELAATEQQIELLMRKADALRRLIDQGQMILASAGIPVTIAQPVNVSVTLRGVEATATAGAVKPIGSLKGRVTEAVEEILRAGQPKMARELLVMLNERGIEVGGKDPAANLAAIMANAKDRFRNERGVGYFIVDPPKTEPDDVGASPGPLRNPSHAPDQGTVPATD